MQYILFCCVIDRISLNTMTLQIQSEHVYTQLGVAISVTGIAQVSDTISDYQLIERQESFGFIDVLSI